MPSTLGHYILLFSFLLLAAPNVAHTQTQRYAVIVGNNSGGKLEVPLKYAQRDAKKMYNILTELGRFEKENTYLLLEQQATSVWQALKKIQTKAQASHKRGQKTLLLIYYSGHAQTDAIEMNGSTLKFKSLRKFLEQSNIHIRLAFIDSCHSGKLITPKGMRKGKPFQIRLNDEISSSGYAIISSSSQNELSQESKELRGAFFTHHLVSALRGEGDASRDNKVTLQEAYKYAYAKTLAQTVGKIGASQHPMYHFQLKGQGEIILTHMNKKHTYIEIPFVEPGRILLLDGLGEEVLAEATADRSHNIRFSVPSGMYIVYIVKNNGIVHMAEVDVPPHQHATLSADDFFTPTLIQSVAKGGLFLVPESTWNHKIGIGGLWRNGPLQDMNDAMGFLIHYRLQHINGLQPTVRLSTTTAPNAGLSIDYKDIGFWVGIGYVFEMKYLYFRMELLLGYEHMFQAKMLEKSRPHSSAFSALGATGIEIPISFMYACLDTSVGGRMFQIQNAGWLPRLDVQVALSMGFRWGKE